MKSFDAIDLAKAIYAHHRKRRGGATWEALPELARVDRVRAAARLQLAYRRPAARESRIEG